MFERHGIGQTPSSLERYLVIIKIGLSVCLLSAACLLPEGRADRAEPYNLLLLLIIIIIVKLPVVGGSLFLNA